VRSFCFTRSMCARELRRDLLCAVMQLVYWENGPIPSAAALGSGLLFAFLLEFAHYNVVSAPFLPSSSSSLCTQLTRVVTVAIGCR
jgi:hypothetical protein